MEQGFPHKLRAFLHLLLDLEGKLLVPLLQVLDLSLGYADTLVMLRLGHSCADVSRRLIDLLCLFGVLRRL
jgi:hypothetical protein